jgi:hypothetical protein
MKKINRNKFIESIMDIENLPELPEEDVVIDECNGV